MIYNEETGKSIEAKWNTVDGVTGDNIIVIFEDGSQQTFPHDLWRMVAFLIIGMTDAKKD